MTRVAAFVACIGLLCLGAGTQAWADPVTITGGSILFPEENRFQAGPISIAGTRGFSITGSVDTGEGRVDPLNQCFPCEPTTNFSVGMLLGTFGLVGSATLDAKTYENINSFSSSNFVFFHLVGATELPPVNGSSVVIRAPFTVAPDSFFEYEVTPGSDSQGPQTASVLLRGAGIATVSFHANPSLPLWEFSQARYDFKPTPEPATLVLVGGAFALTLVRGRKRPTSNSTRL